MANVILKLPAATERTGLSRAALYILISEGKFPTQVRLNKRSCGWLESEVQEWIDQRVEERNEGLPVFDKLNVMGEVSV